MARSLLFEPSYRNSSERFLGALLDEEGVEFLYEDKGSTLEYDVPARVSKYLPDFVIRGTNIILEYKGWFGRNGAKERQKLLLLKEQYPHLDIRLVFSNAKNKLYSGSKTTYAEWADENGFKWCEIRPSKKRLSRAKLPAKWLREIRAQQQKRK